MTKKYAGELEIDRERGVLYFHENRTGLTLLRVCRLPRPMPYGDFQIDVAASPETSYSSLLEEV